jgi:ElaB/YqjD/DUF883 family membrane-anchored ribosome-binding protein
MPTTNGHASEPNLVQKVVRQLPIDPESADEIERRLLDTDRQVRSFVRENPTATVVGAVALGFLIGRMVTR